VDERRRYTAPFVFLGIVRRDRGVSGNWNIPYFRHELGQAELHRLAEVLKGYILTTGAEVAEFAKRFAGLSRRRSRVRAPSLPPVFNDLGHTIIVVPTFWPVAFRLWRSLRSQFASTATPGL